MRATRQPARFAIERPQALCLPKQIVTSSHITSNSNRAPVGARAEAESFRSIRSRGIGARSLIRQDGPHRRHPKEMRLQSRGGGVARQLHALRCQTQALQLTPSQVVRLGHGAPPLTTDARSSHGIAAPVGGLGHGRQSKYWIRTYPKCRGTAECRIAQYFDNLLTSWPRRNGLDARIQKRLTEIRAFDLLGASKAYRTFHGSPLSSPFYGMKPGIHILLRLSLGDTIALLDRAFELITTTIHFVEFIVRELAPIFFHLPFDLLPISFNPIPVHCGLLF
jgi:hypothetical protein